MIDIPTDPVFSVEGKTVAITGACGLIGRAMVAAFAARGAKLALIDVAAADPAGAAAACGAEAIGLACDVSRAAEVSAALDAVVDRFGNVGALINNHQYKPQGFLEARAETFPEELWDAIVDVNLKGTFLTCREFGRHMLERGKGSIVNLASTYGVVSSNPMLYTDNAMGNPLAYTASKGGVVMLTKYLAVYWAKRGVRVNALTPHGVWNNHEQAFVDRFSAISPMGRLMRPEEIVGATLFLASDASSYVTGSNVLVEGGWTAW
jgi:NAD(P)-dependent dehydrogenase (short-subunit alcohol dehydrogenase family)